MLLQFAGSFPSCSRKAASPLLTGEACRPERKENQGIKTGLPLARVKRHLIIKLKKHTNEPKPGFQMGCSPEAGIHGAMVGRICVFALTGPQAKRLTGGPDTGVNRRVGRRGPSEVLLSFPKGVIIS